MTYPNLESADRGLDELDQGRALASLGQRAVARIAHIEEADALLEELEAGGRFSHAALRALSASTSDLAASALEPAANIELEAAASAPEPAANVELEAAAPAPAPAPEPAADVELEAAAEVELEAVAEVELEDVEDDDDSEATMIMDVKSFLASRPVKAASVPPPPPKHEAVARADEALGADELAALDSLEISWDD